jgi:hypothetical protein
LREGVSSGIFFHTLRTDSAAAGGAENPAHQIPDGRYLGLEPQVHVLWKKSPLPEMNLQSQDVMFVLG